ncbi:MAG TPA: ArsR family transcriptional regulator [Acidimicrobiia bacterium]|nr:ArsR family transcriptional regulator [Acidimicrobiia bacterium]
MTPTRDAASATTGPPLVYQLVAHPIRWKLLRELAHSDHAVHELTRLLGERQSLVSYHLHRLRAAELVRTRRSAADGRDRYYAVDLARCGELLQSAGGALHPALRFVPRELAHDRRRTRARHRVLYLCTGNSARSQMAEALTQHISRGTVAAVSAGSNPKPLHPTAVRVMKKRGLDIAANRTKHLDEFVNQRFDAVVTLCDRVREVCPEFPSAADRVHWSIPDPGAVSGDDRARLAEFERVATELETRIGFLVRVLDERTTRRFSHAQR